MNISSIGTTRPDGSVVINKSLKENTLFALTCLVFTIGGIIIMPEQPFWGWAAIVFFGGGGLFYLIAFARQPLLIITKEGVRAPVGFQEGFLLPWSEIRDIKLIDVQGKTHVGIFGHNYEDDDGASFGEALGESITGLDEIPDISILANQFAKCNANDVIQLLKEYQVKYA